MTPDQLLVLGTAFAAYLRIFEVCIAYKPTAEHLHSYCRGLLSDLARKSVEPIALACGTAVRTLQEFLRDHVWDQFRMRDLLQQRLRELPALNAADDLGTIGVIDETSVAKKGTKTPGVHRQYCGAQRQNRQLHRHRASGDRSRSLQDADRCRVVFAQSLE